MVKGDVYVETLNAAGSFQPAAGVEVCIRSLSNTPANGGCAWEFYDGASAGRFAQIGVGSVALSVETAVCVFITNTIYIHTADAGGTISGVQVK